MRIGVQWRSVVPSETQAGCRTRCLVNWFTESARVWIPRVCSLCQTWLSFVRANSSLGGAGRQMLVAFWGGGGCFQTARKCIVLPTFWLNFPVSTPIKYGTFPPFVYPVGPDETSAQPYPSRGSIYATGNPLFRYYVSWMMEAHWLVRRM